MVYPASQYKSPQLQKLAPFVLEYWLTATTKTLTLPAQEMGYPIIHGCDATDFVQATVDTFLGIANDVVVATSFGSTAMGTDAYGFIINMQGQAAQAAWACATVYLATPVPNGVIGAGSVTTALPNTLTQGCAVTAGGNIYGRLILAGLDAGTAAVQVRVGVLLK